MRAIDLFAGAGGFTEGAEQAGCRVVWAANHWETAVATHAVNHGDTIHACQDLRQANWMDVPEHDLLLASPCCHGHSPARGKDRPHHEASRSTAWAVVDCAEYHRPPFWVVENVPDFLTWRLYPSFCDAMRRLGYSLSPHILDAADHGVPQNRPRLFLIGSRSKHPIRLNLAKADHVPVAQIVRWDDHPWSPVNKPGRRPNTLRRIANGRTRFGDRFVMPYYGSGSGLTGRSLERPLGTVTTRDRWALVDGERMRMLSIPEYLAAQGFPAGYRLPARKDVALKLIGNAVAPPVARDVINALRAAA